MYASILMRHYGIITDLEVGSYRQVAETKMDTHTMKDRWSSDQNDYI